ncbi:transmembrane protein FAM155B [Ornithorhynchus anatinus]|uniref:transmembrane protein FAM155B n=1 Tax=Ornithorhynchus anatinus TaxID=9258 RepID=UPI0019D440DB|nr:transmembrane protein FAM155B [Ornithorhynchus anatinus]
MVRGAGPGVEKEAPRGRGRGRARSASSGGRRGRWGGGTTCRRSWPWRARAPAPWGPRPADKPRADSDRAQRWRLSLATLLFFTVPLSARLRLGAGTPGPPAAGRAWLAGHLANFSLAFCDAYTVWDLLAATDDVCSPDALLDDVPPAGRGGPGPWDSCAGCVRAYRRLDRHAREKYDEFDSFLRRYLPAEDYSVRSCLGDCKAVYKAWLCSEYFNVTQQQCRRRVPCKQYCLEVQTRCPFVLPDNDDLIYGGLPGFICAGWLEAPAGGEEAECCDVKWDSCDLPPDGGNASARTPESQPTPDHHQQQQQRRPRRRRQQQRRRPPRPARSAHARPSPPPVSAGSRLRLRLCVLVLVLLRTVVSLGGGGAGLEALPPREEGGARDE